MFFTDFGSVFETMFFTGCAGLIIAAILYFAFWLFTRKKFTASIPAHVLRYLFLTYCLCIILLTWTSKGDFNLGANFIPLSSVFYAIRSGFETSQNLILLNILMFVPMGIFLPLVFSKTDKLWKAILICFGATLLIETVQALLPGRAFDIDDVIMNTLGGAIGFSLYILALWMLKKPRQTLFAKLSAISILLIIPVFLGAVSVFDSKEFRYNFSYRLHVPKEIALVEEKSDYPQTAAVYAKDIIDPYAVMADLQAKFNVTGDIEDTGSSIQSAYKEKSLHVFIDMPSWGYMLRASNNIPPTLSDAELIAQSKSFLEEYDLWDEAYTLEYIANIETDTRIDIGEEESTATYDEFNKPDYIQITGRTVSFSIDAAEKFVHTIIFFDSDGIYQIDFFSETYEIYKEMPLFSPEKAMQALSRSNNCILYVDMFEPESAIFTEAILVYTDSLDQKYRLPAWKLSGTFYGKDTSGQSSQATGHILIEAIKQ